MQFSVISRTLVKMRSDQSTETKSAYSTSLPTDWAVMGSSKIRNRFQIIKYTPSPEQVEHRGIVFVLFFYFCDDV